MAEKFVGFSGCQKMIHGKQQREKHAVREHKVRIVGGMWKRTPLSVTNVDGLRPTSERIRETLFNWLVHLRGNRFGQMHCLDLFAGTGALGFEAASRGLAHVTMIEENLAAYAQLQIVKKKLNATQISIHRADALVFARQIIGSDRLFDLIFLDPPFQKDLLLSAVPICIQLLKNNGLVYIESNERITHEKLYLWMEKDVSNLQMIREGQAGQVYYHLLEIQV